MLKIGDKVKQRRDLVTVWQGPNGSENMNSETIYTVSASFLSEFNGKPHILADDGRRFTGGPAEHFIQV